MATQSENVPDLICAPDSPAPMRADQSEETADEVAPASAETNAVALFSFQGQDETELDFSEGDVLEIIGELISL